MAGGTEHQPSAAELVKQASEQSAELVRAEIRLAVAELKDKGRHAGLAGGLFGGAGTAAGYGVAVLLVAVVAALDLVLPLWAAALIVAVVLLAGAATLAVVGRKQLAQALPPTP